MRLRDDFSDARSPGKVIGTPSTSGTVRQGADIEKTLSVDHGALRISPLITPGWQRSGIAYGPYPRQAGLALSAFILNGHSASEGNTIEESLKGRFFRWLRGSETDPIAYRLSRWIVSQHHRHRLWHFYRWLRNHPDRFEKDQHIKENLMLGWFSEALPADAAGNSFVVRTAGPENGELCASIHHCLAPVLKGLQNLQIYYIIVLRENGAAYYASTLPNADQLSAYPHMRLLGIDTQRTEEKVYAGLYQAALGQVGFRIDSRVYGMRAEVLPTLASWYGSAHIADSLVGASTLENSRTETTDVWQVVQGGYERTALGAVGRQSCNVAMVKTKEAVGAVHVIVRALKPDTACALLWRSQDEHNTWGFFLTAKTCELKICERGDWCMVKKSDRLSLIQNAPNAIQVIDDGASFSLYLNGQLAFGKRFSDTRFQTEVGIGLLSLGAAACFREIEAHPRQVPIPPELRMGAPWQQQGSRIGLSDSFDGDCKLTLQEHSCATMTQPWQKTIGHGNMRLTGKNAVKVEASSASPNPKRLAYTLPWNKPDFADVSVDILSPGTERGEGEKGRGGVIFWQDAKHYLIVNHWLDDTFDGAAMSAFLTVDGYEEIYDGVWANVGKRITWGARRRHRVAFDGTNFVVYVEGEPVLSRSVLDIYPTANPLQIRRVGIVANWEWGDDTGSEFSNFSALF